MKKKLILGAILALPLCARAHDMCPSGAHVTVVLSEQGHDFEHMGITFEHGGWNYHPYLPSKLSGGGGFVFNKAGYGFDLRFGRDDDRSMHCIYKRENPEDDDSDIVTLSITRLHECILDGESWEAEHPHYPDVKVCRESREECKFTCEAKPPLTFRRDR